MSGVFMVGRHHIPFFPSSRFKAVPHDASETYGSWGWRFVAYSAKSQDHGLEQVRYC